MRFLKCNAINVANGVTSTSCSLNVQTQKNQAALRGSGNNIAPRVDSLKNMVEHIFWRRCFMQKKVCRVLEKECKIMHCKTIKYGHYH